jgi:two-component system phosphate regulon sensor histidine kinase PhoR
MRGWVSAAVPAFACLAALPASTLLVLWAAGALRGWAVWVALAAVMVSAAAASLWLVRDLGKLGEALRRAMAEDSAGLALAVEAPWMAPVATVARGIERLSRTLTARAGQVEALFRATEAIVERLPDPLLVLGPDRAVRRANAAARAAFGADIPAMLRHPVLRAAMEDAWRTRGAAAVDLELPAPVERDLRATVLYLDPPLADGGQALVLLSDRTREKRVERMRADFVANASHELRTPLASLIGFIDTLRGPASDDPPAQARFLGIMAEQAGRMTRLIDDLLSLSRIELNEHQAPADQVDLRQVVVRVMAAFEPRLAERRMRAEMALDDAVPQVMADAEQMAQLLSNLVDNAVKYGRDGGQILVSLEVAAPGGRYPARPGVVLRVRDDGAGIAKEHLPRLTERFYRVDRARSRNTGGTGLGLAIVKHIVNRHRGVLGIESEAGVGTMFAVWLPVAQEGGAADAEARVILLGGA